MSDFAKRLAVNPEAETLQFSTDKLKQYFNPDVKDLKKTSESRSASTENNLWLLNSVEKEQLQTSIADYLNTMDVVLENWQTCKASKLIQRYKTYGEAIAKVEAWSENLLNITCALTSMHSFLAGKGRLQYEKAGQYAEDYICNVSTTKPKANENWNTTATKNSVTTKDTPVIKAKETKTTTTPSKSTETVKTTVDKEKTDAENITLIDPTENRTVVLKPRTETFVSPHSDIVRRERALNGKTFDWKNEMILETWITSLVEGTVLKDTSNSPTAFTLNFPLNLVGQTIVIRNFEGNQWDAEYIVWKDGKVKVSKDNYSSFKNLFMPNESELKLYVSNKSHDPMKEYTKTVTLKIETIGTKNNVSTTADNTTKTTTDKTPNNTTTPTENWNTTKDSPKVEQKPTEKPKVEDVVPKKVVEVSKKIEVADTLEHKDLLNGVEVSPLYPKEDGTFERVLYKIGKDNTYHEIGKINYEKDKHITAENQTIKLNLIDWVDWGTVTMNVIEKGENGDYTINFVNNKEAKAYKEKLQAQKDILKKFTISGANPERYTTLVPNTKVEDDQTKFNDDYINSLQPDFHGSYTLPLAKDRYLSFSFDEDNKLVVKNNDKQISPRDQSYMPSKDDASKIVLDKWIYTNLENTLVKVEVDTDSNRITFNEFETTDSENRVTKNGKQVNTIDNYYNKKKIENLPPVEVILPWFENKPFKVVPEWLNLSVENGIINLFSAWKNILRTPSDLDIPDDKVWQYHAFEANEKENGDADLFDKTLVEKPGMTKNMKDYDISCFLYTEDKNLKPKWIRIVNPQSWAERYVSVEITDKVIANGEHTQKLIVKENTLENKKIADRMKALNTLMKRVDEVMNISTIKNNAFDKPSMVAITDDYIREQIGDKDKKIAKEDLYTEWFNKMVTNDKQMDEFIDDKGVVDFSGVTIQRKMKTKVQEYDKDKKVWITKDVIVPIDIALNKDGNIQERAYGDQTWGTVKIGKQEYYPFIRWGQLELKTEEEMNWSIQNLPWFEQAFELPERKNIALNGHNAILSIANVTDATKSDVFDTKSIESNIVSINNYFTLLLNDKVPQNRKQKAINQYNGAKDVTEMSNNLNKVFASLYKSGKSMGTLLYIKDNVLSKVPNPSEFIKQQKEATKEVKKAIDRKLDGLAVVTPPIKGELDTKTLQTLLNLENKQIEIKGIKADATWSILDCIINGVAISVKTRGNPEELKKKENITAIENDINDAILLNLDKIRSDLYKKVVKEVNKDTGVTTYQFIRLDDTADIYRLSDIKKVNNIIDFANFK